jgi:hypothetical protein
MSHRGLIMLDIQALEDQIIGIEKFAVRITATKGRRSQQRKLPDYPFEKPADNEATVRSWKEQRFLKTYPKCEVEVLYGDGTPVTGSVSLMSVRLSGIAKRLK